ncbi:ribonuclease III [Christensenella intestinihominis]|uniref:ribonuclease III n=1 Tax=Christensenella intestinihominis TaxID=1851429 RepID=UPI000B1EB673|nr:ribonuclease III [Christensenella intestinihominis]
MKHEGLEKRIGYSFHDSRLLERALTHPSCGNVPNYERLEFLGDAVIELIISGDLFKNYPDSSEGVLTQRRADIVCSKSLARIAQSIALGSYIFLGKGEEESGGREKTSILENVMEALMGAVYVDGGFGEAQRVVRNLFADAIEGAMNRKTDHDYKSQFQELIQRTVKQAISYQVTRQEGPPHNTVFHVQLSVGGKALNEGMGNSKKEAEQNAAKSAIADFEKIYKE